jgi:SAM-dependent methyltransferase
MIDLVANAVNLEQTSDGIWRCKAAASPISYPEWGNEACFEVEDVSFWFQHRNVCIREELKQYPPSGPVFDIGGGNGFVAKAMQDVGFEVVLLEPGASGCHNAQRRGIQNVVCARLEDAGFVPASIAAVGLFDVIEHLENDREFLEMVGSYLWPNGRVYITVPAHRALWSQEDANAGHFRRYSRQALDDVLKVSGFTVDFLTGFFQYLPPAILAGRVIPYRLGAMKRGSQGVNGNMRDEHEVRSPLVRRLLVWLQSREVAQMCSRREVSFGGSWLAVARKNR